MRCLSKNKSKFYYALYGKKTEIFDAYGNRTGEYAVTYGYPVESFGNISAARGETQSRQFGESVEYDKVIVLDTPNTPIDEYSVLWVDKYPKIENDVSTVPYDYVVKRVARSLNSVAIAISKVDIR